MSRRNSISLPAKLDSIDDSLDQSQSSSPDISIHGGDVTSDDDLFSDVGISEDEIPDIRRCQPRKLRRKSAMPTKFKLHETELLALDQSPQNSITSVNSISSLLREKIVLTLPSMLKKKKRPQQYKLKSFIGILFISIVILIGYVHVHYQLNILQRPYFDWIRFNIIERRIHVYNDNGIEVLRGIIGTSFGKNRMYDCLIKHRRTNSECMEWIKLARLYLSYRKIWNTNCYNIFWQSLREDVDLKDCYEISKEFGHWYGGGQTRNMTWPMEKGSINSTPFITSNLQNHEWGNVLRRSFYSSKGVAIIIDDNTPLYVSMNSEKDNMFCLKAKYDDFAYVHKPTPLPTLNYTICTATNVLKVHASLTEKNLWDGVREEEKVTIYTLLTEPLWEISPSSSDSLSDSAVYNYTDDIISSGFLRQGHVLLNEFWQPHVGDFILDDSRFSTMKETINIIHRRGFRIVLSVQPFISTESVNFKETVEKRLLVSERNTESYIPALTKYKSLQSAGILDVTNTLVEQWLHSKLKHLKDEFNIDGFYIDYGNAYDLPRHYQFEKPIKNPDSYKAMFTRIVLRSGDVLGVSGAIVRPRAPIFVSLPPLFSSWDSLRILLHSAVTYSVSGYPFIIPGAVGGDNNIPRQNTFDVTNEQANDEDRLSLPDKELYIRWLQLATFLPVIHYTQLPSKYGDDSILEMLKLLTTLRVNIVNNLLKKYVGEALEFGKPLIRPLWMLDPNDAACLTISDEFSIGVELIVAPILTPGTFERDVYLPAGVWKDGMDGSLRKGSRWLHHFRVPLNKVAYFIKMPNNTRF